MEKRGGRGDEKKDGVGRVILPFAIRKGFVYYVDEQGNLREVKAEKGVGEKIKQEKITGKKVSGFGVGQAATGVKFAESGLKRYRNIYLTVCMASLIVAIFALFKDDYFVLTLSAVGLALALIFFSIINHKIEKVRVLSGGESRERKFGERRVRGLPAFIPLIFFIAAVLCAVLYFLNEESIYLILSGAIFVVFIIFFIIYLTVTKRGKPKKEKSKKKSFKDFMLKKKHKKGKRKEEGKIIAQKSLVLAAKMKEDRVKEERRKAIHAAKSNIQFIFFFMAMALGVLGTISYFNRDFISMAVTGLVLILAIVIYFNFIKSRKKKKYKEEKKPEEKKEEKPKKEEKKIIAKKPEFKAKRKEEKVRKAREPGEKAFRAPMVIAIIFFFLALALGVFAYLREDTLSLIISGATLMVSFLLYIFFMTRLKRKKVATKKARLHRIVGRAAKQRRIISKTAGPLPKHEFMDAIREQERLVTKSRIVPIFFLIIALGLGTLAFLKKESLSLIMAVAALGVIFILLFAASRVDKKLKKQKMKIAIRQLRREKRGMETDIDLLLGLLERFKKMKLKEISYAFDIYEDKAEEWAKILEEGGFATMYYPAFGGVELRWKKK